MRHFYVLTLFLVIACPSFAQRRWTPVITPNVGAAPSLASTQNAAYFFDDSVSSTYDQGLRWQSVTGISKGCKAILSFVNNTTLAFSQSIPGGEIESFYSLTGISWTASDTLNFNGKNIVVADAVDDKAYLVMREGWVYTWSAAIDSVFIEQAGGDVQSFVATKDALLADTKGGLAMSTNGTDWSIRNPPSNRKVMDVTSAITHYNGALVAATEIGVFQFSPTTNEWQALGVWPTEASGLDITKMTADKSRIIAMVRTSENRHQLYRLEATDTAWIPTGYEIPMDEPSADLQSLIIDAGWALTYQSSSAEPDSTGLYAYNLNDYTDVAEANTTADVRITTTREGITISSEEEGLLRVDVVSLDGRLLYSCETIAPYASIPLPSSVGGVCGIVVHTALGKVARTVILR